MLFINKWTWYLIVVVNVFIVDLVSGHCGGEILWVMIVACKNSIVILAHVQLIVPHNQLILCPASVCG
jgi:hypothetical protein